MITVYSEDHQLHDGLLETVGDSCAVFGSMGSCVRPDDTSSKAERGAAYRDEQSRQGNEEICAVHRERGRAGGARVARREGDSSRRRVRVHMLLKVNPIDAALAVAVPGNVQLSASFSTHAASSPPTVSSLVLAAVTFPLIEIDRLNLRAPDAPSLSSSNAA